MNYKLINVGEIRFGPPFFKLILDGVEIENRVFGEDQFVSNDEQYIVLQEWLSTEYSKGPMTRPLVIDTKKRTFTAISSGKPGFSEGFLIEENVLIYTQTNKGTGMNKIYECNLELLKFVAFNELQ